MYEVLPAIAASEEHVEDVDVPREHAEVSRQEFAVEAVNKTPCNFMVFSLGYFLGESGYNLEVRGLENLLKETSTASNPFAVVEQHLRLLLE